MDIAILSVNTENHFNSCVRGGDSRMKQVGGEYAGMKRMMMDSVDLQVIIKMTKTGAIPGQVGSHLLSGMSLQNHIYYFCDSIGGHPRNYGDVSRGGRQWLLCVTTSPGVQNSSILPRALPRVPCHIILIATTTTLFCIVVYGVLLYVNHLGWSVWYSVAMGIYELC